MAKGFLITPEVEALVVAIHHNNRKWKPKEVRLVARNILHERAVKKPKEYPDLQLKLDTGWPSLSSVRGKAFSKGKSGKTKHNPEGKDKPWCIATLDDYPIPPEAIPVVMSFYKKRLAKDDVLTIREALWTARLYKIVDPLDLVFDWAFLYATDEMIADETGKPFGGRERDLELINNPQAAREVMREIDIWKIATKYKADPMQLKELNLSLEETEEAAKTGKYKQEAQNE